jgi:hypothetical protein
MLQSAENNIDQIVRDANITQNLSPELGLTICAPLFGYADDPICKMKKTRFDRFLKRGSD